MAHNLRPGDISLTDWFCPGAQGSLVLLAKNRVRLTIVAVGLIGRGLGESLGSSKCQRDSRMPGGDITIRR
jgi:hypothetical protein